MKPPPQSIPQTTLELQDMASAMQELSLEIVKLSKTVAMVRDEAANGLRDVRKLTRLIAEARKP